jgi:hypothetical protein
MQACPGWLFELWQQYAELEPFGGLQDDLRAGHIAHTVYSMGRGKDSPDLNPAHWFASLGQMFRPVPMSTEAMIEAGRQSVKAGGGQFMPPGYRPPRPPSRARKNF